MPFPNAVRRKHRVVLIDDHVTITELLAQVIESREDDFEVVGHAHNGPAGLELCRRTQPDLAVLDLIMPGMNGVELLRELSRLLPELRIIIFTGGVHPGLLTEALRLGAHGLVSKSAGAQPLRDAMRAVAAGGRYLDPTLLPQIGQGSEPPISPRERQVLRHIAVGGSNKEIAASLGVSVKTVENHRTNLMEKLDLHDAVSLTRYAIRTGLVSAD